MHFVSVKIKKMAKIKKKIGKNAFCVGQNKKMAKIKKNGKKQWPK